MKKKMLQTELAQRIDANRLAFEYECPKTPGAWMNPSFTASRALAYGYRIREKRSQFGLPCFVVRSTTAVAAPTVEQPKVSTQRQAFESWWRSEGRGLLYRDSAGRYTTDAARAAWAAWQAAIPEVTRAPRLEDSDMLAIHRQAYDLARTLGHPLPQAELLAVSAVRRAISHDLSFRRNTVSRCNLAEYLANCLTRKAVSGLDESQQRLIHKLTDGVLDHLGLADYDEPKEPKDRDATAFITHPAKPEERMAA